MPRGHSISGTQHLFSSVFLPLSHGFPPRVLITHIWINKGLESSYRLYLLMCRFCIPHQSQSDTAHPWSSWYQAALEEGASRVWRGRPRGSRRSWRFSIINTWEHDLCTVKAAIVSRGSKGLNILSHLMIYMWGYLGCIQCKYKVSMLH